MYRMISSTPSPVRSAKISRQGCVAAVFCVSGGEHSFARPGESSRSAFHHASGIARPAGVVANAGTGAGAGSAAGGWPLARCTSSQLS
ncbi:hypothetical protein G6F22_022122 [Rhizopus arrhizus]|nr:hypothetical protein G6F22_022122 [Rhizopus arrhizus]